MLPVRLIENDETKRQLVISESKRRCCLAEVNGVNLPSSGGSSEMGFPSSSNVFRDLNKHHRLLDDCKDCVLIKTHVRS